MAPPLLQYMSLLVMAMALYLSAGIWAVVNNDEDEVSQLLLAVLLLLVILLMSTAAKRRHPEIPQCQFR